MSTPEIGVEYVSLATEKIATVLDVGHHDFGPPDVWVEEGGRRYSIAGDTFARYWKPVLQPIVDGRVELVEYDLRGNRYLTTSTAAVKHSATGRKVVLLPDRGNWDDYYKACAAQRERGVWYVVE